MTKKISRRSVILSVAAVSTLVAVAPTMLLYRKLKSFRNTTSNAPLSLALKQCNIDHVTYGTFQKLYHSKLTENDKSDILLQFTQPNRKRFAYRGEQKLGQCDYFI